jgi:hypothetical protein
MKRLKRQPDFKPIGAKLEVSGRCSCCRGKFGGYRVKAENTLGDVAYLCIGCADTFRSMGLARVS